MAWSTPAFSRDGGRLAFTATDGSGNNDIWVYELARDNLTKLTTNPASDLYPVWSPDGRWIVYGSQRDREGVSNLYVQRSDGTGDVIRLTDSIDSQVPGSWHPSGNAIAFHEGNPLRERQNLVVLPLDGDSMSGWKAGKPAVFLDGPSLKSQAIFSPDGNWLAYTDNESGRYEIFVRPYPPGPGRWQISSGGGTDPKWSQKQPELLFRTADGQTIQAVRYQVDSKTFRADKPYRWTTGRFGYAPGLRAGVIYDLHPDGERVAGAMSPDTNDATAGREALDTLTFVFGFFDELRRLVPAAK
jgi:Tol biopolymer transport system component